MGAVGSTNAIVAASVQELSTALRRPVRRATTAFPRRRRRRARGRAHTPRRRPARATRGRRRNTTANPRKRPLVVAAPLKPPPYPRRVRLLLTAGHGWWFGPPGSAPSLSFAPGLAPGLAPGFARCRTPWFGSAGCRLGFDARALPNRFVGRWSRHPDRRVGIPAPA